MNLDPRRHRKLDFILVVGAILLLWGPGVTVSPGDAHRGEMVPAAAIETAGRTSSIPCSSHQLPEPPPPAAGGGSAPRIHATVTGYSSSVRETGSTLGVTAAGTPARHGVIALSQDLLREYTPGAPFTFHDRVEIPGVGSFSIEDTMHPRWTRRADIWFSSREEALRWGCRTRYLYRVPASLAEALVLPGRREVAATFGQANFQ
jgi:3D (Asp-Asp-Asp) domain-containing protein